MLVIAVTVKLKLIVKVLPINFY